MTALGVVRNVGVPDGGVARRDSTHGGADEEVGARKDAGTKAKCTARHDYDAREDVAARHDSGAQYYCNARDESDARDGGALRNDAGIPDGWGGIRNEANGGARHDDAARDRSTPRFVRDVGVPDVGGARCDLDDVGTREDATSI